MVMRVVEIDLRRLWRFLRRHKGRVVRVVVVIDDADGRRWSALVRHYGVREVSPEELFPLEPRDIGGVRVWVSQSTRRQ